ncbi:MAG: hypothetical protein WC527_06130 [Candidatus Margulisiibacteriota bacterium]
MIDFDIYGSQMDTASAYIRSTASGVGNLVPAANSFKEVLKQTYAKIDNISNQLASDNDIIMIDDTQVDKTSSSASFLITQKLDDYQQMITMMMDILTKNRDWDKSLGQSMSR